MGFTVRFNFKTELGSPIAHHVLKKEIQTLLHNMTAKLREFDALAKQCPEIKGRAAEKNLKITKSKQSNAETEEENEAETEEEKRERLEMERLRDEQIAKGGEIFQAYLDYLRQLQSLWGEYWDFRLGLENNSKKNSIENPCGNDRRARAREQGFDSAINGFELLRT